MKIINAVEFSEMLQTAPKINEAKFFVHSGNVMAGDHVIPLFFYVDDACQGFLVESNQGKPPVLSRRTGRTDPRGYDDLSDIIKLSPGDMSTGMSSLGDAYFHMAVIRYSSVEALQKAQQDQEAMTHEEFVNASKNALQEASWVTIPAIEPSGKQVSHDELVSELSKPNNINLSIIKFYYDGQLYVVIGKGWREEVMLELIRYDTDVRQAYFSGIVAGKPIYQRVKLEEVSFRGDYDFLQWVKTHNFNTGEAGHGLWWIRHMGVSLHTTSNSLTLKNPHLSVRGQVKTIPDNYDTINNRTIIL